jgi:hypothetical protein
MIKLSFVSVKAQVYKWKSEGIFYSTSFIDDIKKFTKKHKNKPFKTEIEKKLLKIKIEGINAVKGLIVEGLKAGKYKSIGKVYRIRILKNYRMFIGYAEENIEIVGKVDDKNSVDKYISEKGSSDIFCLYFGLRKDSYSKAVLGRYNIIK